MSAIESTENTADAGNTEDRTAVMAESRVTGRGGSATGEHTGVVEVRRNARLAAAVATAAVLVAAAFFVRGGGLSYGIGALLLVVAALQAWTAYDGRMPLLLVDEQGVRFRCGQTWRGLPWSEVEEIEHLPRRSWRKDGRLAVLPVDEDDQVESLGRDGWHARTNQRLYGVPFAVPLGLGTRVVGADGDLTGAIAHLAGESTGVVEIDETLAVDESFDEPDAEPFAEPDAEPDAAYAEPVDAHAYTEAVEAPAEAHPYAEAEETVPIRAAALRPAVEDDVTVPVREDTRPRLGRRLFGRRSALPDDATTPDDAAADHTSAEPALADTDEEAFPTSSPTPSPLREPTIAVRTDARWPGADREDTTTAVRGANALRLDPAEWDGDRTGGAPTEMTERIELPEGVSPIARPGQPVEPLVLDDPDLTGVMEPAPEPVIGPELAAARTRLGLTVDTLAERTRIRPHVIESIEVDDFGPCGGDFYARGHLRTLARVLAVDAAPLLAAYDERYASGPVNPRAVFEAELASGSTGTLHQMRGGPNWSVLVAAVMAVVLIWSVARLVTAPGEEQPDAAISLGSGSADNQPYAHVADPVPVVLTAAGGGAHVVVRDARGQVVFTGDLAFGETKTFKVSPPVRVQTSDGSLEVAVDNGRPEALGKTGEAAQKTLTVD